MTLREQEQTLELEEDRTQNSHTLDSFWSTAVKEYPVVPNRAISTVLPSSMTYLCELDFSTLTAIKAKNRERMLSLDEEVRACRQFLTGYHICVHLSRSH